MIRPRKGRKSFSSEERNEMRPALRLRPPPVTPGAKKKTYSNVATGPVALRSARTVSEENTQPSPRSSAYFPSFAKEKRILCPGSETCKFPKTVAPSFPGPMVALAGLGLPRLPPSLRQLRFSYRILRARKVRSILSQQVQVPLLTSLASIFHRR